MSMKLEENKVNNEEVVIKVRNLIKDYKLYDKPIHRLIDIIPFVKNKHRRNFRALDGISFDVKKGEILGLVGSNGAGKSTTLKILTGVSGYKGEVDIRGKVSSLLELGTGFDMELTGLENIYYQGYLSGLTKIEVDAKVADIKEFADIGDFINEPVKKYSSGMFARLAFATAINVEPDILIIDEVLSVGDLRFTIKCLKKIEEMSKQGVTIIFVSHSSEQITRHCQRVIWIKDHKIFKEGTPFEIMPEYNDYMIFGDTNQNEEISESDKNVKINVTGEGDEKVAITNVRFNNDDANHINGDTKEISWDITFKVDPSLYKSFYFSTLITNENSYPLMHKGIEMKLEDFDINENNEFVYNMVFREPKFKNGEFAVSFDVGWFDEYKEFHFAQKLNSLFLLSVSKKGDNTSGWGSFTLDSLDDYGKNYK